MEVIQVGATHHRRENYDAPVAVVQWKSHVARRVLKAEVRFCLIPHCLSFESPRRHFPEMLQSPWQAG